MSEAKVTDRHGRVLFRGNRADAEKFLADNFPRVHVEPGTDYGDDGPQPDATVSGGEDEAEAEPAAAEPEPENPEPASDDSVAETVTDAEHYTPRRRRKG